MTNQQILASSWIGYFKSNLKYHFNILDHYPVVVLHNSSIDTTKFPFTTQFPYHFKNLQGHPSSDQTVFRVTSTSCAKGMNALPVPLLTSTGAQQLASATPEGY